jgi:hypothetical protein
MNFKLTNGIPNPNEPETPITSQEAVKQLRGVRAGIRGFVQLQKAQMRAMAHVANLDPEFLEGAFAAISESAVLQAAIGTNDQQLRADRQNAAEWKGVIEEVDALRDGVRSTVALQQHQLASTALHAYAVARNLIRNGAHADLVPYVETMRLLLRSGKRQKAEPKVTPQAPKV